MSISRFSFTKSQRGLLNFAVSIKVLDAVELGVLMENEGANFPAIEAEISTIAFCDRGRGVHGAWVEARDAHYKAARSAMQAAQDVVLAAS